MSFETTKLPVAEWEQNTELSRLLFSRYHTGSLAFGSLIIAIVQLIRAALEYLDHTLNGTVCFPNFYNFVNCFARHDVCLGLK